MEGSTRDKRFDGQHRVKEGRAGAAERLRNLDAHDAEIEQLGDEPVRDPGLLIHFADQRPDFPVRERVDAVAKQRLVLGQVCQAAGMATAEEDVSLNSPS